MGEPRGDARIVVDTGVHALDVSTRLTSLELSRQAFSAELATMKSHIQWQGAGVQQGQMAWQHSSPPVQGLCCVLPKSSADLCDYEAEDNELRVVATGRNVPIPMKQASPASDDRRFGWSWCRDHC